MTKTLELKAKHFRQESYSSKLMSREENYLGCPVEQAADEQLKGTAVETHGCLFVWRNGMNQRWEHSHYSTTDFNVDLAKSWEMQDEEVIRTIELRLKQEKPEGAWLGH